MGPVGKCTDPGLVIRVVYALCLFGATYNHVATIAAHGLFWDYGGMPWPSVAFWTALAFADPMAALLLFLRPRQGLIATAAIIAVDVAHNCWIVVWEGERHGFPQRLGNYWVLIVQIAFLLFVAATIHLAWNPLAAKRAR